MVVWRADAEHIVEGANAGEDGGGYAVMTDWQAADMPAEAAATLLALTPGLHTFLNDQESSRSPHARARRRLCPQTCRTQQRHAADQCDCYGVPGRVPQRGFGIKTPVSWHWVRSAVRNAIGVRSGHLGTHISLGVQHDLSLHVSESNIADELL